MGIHKKGLAQYAAVKSVRHHAPALFFLDLFLIQQRFSSQIFSLRNASQIRCFLFHNILGAGSPILLITTEW